MKEVLGWSKRADDAASVVLKFTDIKSIGYGYQSDMTVYKKTSDFPPGTRTPTSSSGEEERLTAPPAGPAKGFLVSAPRIPLTTCFTIKTQNESYDFFTVTESETYDWIIKLSKVLRPYKVLGMHDR